MLETLLISPLMAYYLYYLSYNGGNAYQSADVHTLIFFMLLRYRDCYAFIIILLLVHVFYH